MTDWRDLPRGELTFEMLPPANLDDSYGTLDGVVLSGCKIDEDYYTDARVSAEIEFVGDRWVRQSAIRITYRVPEMGYEEELGTFFASDDGSSVEKGARTTKLKLFSALDALSRKKGTQHWLAAGCYARSAMRQICESEHRELVDDGANDHMYSELSWLDSDKTFLDHMYSLCNDANDRLEVDGHGRIVVGAYVQPSKRTPCFEIDLNDPRGVAHDGVERSSNYLSMPSEYHIVYRWTEGSGDDAQKKELKGSAYADGHVSFGARGYTVSEVEVLNDLDPATEWKAAEIARERLDAIVEDVEWRLDCEYLPIHRGDVGWLKGLQDIPDYAGDKLVMVKSVDLDLETMRMGLVLKSVHSADWSQE